ncbi:hypothetical protein [Microbacter margulisiae]|uniref:Transposase n=1 Tax=Microbacter margulisiae TaxID=1350067 RepID=A0A7W5H148_9PORP|nr:hypothetical protein [Microbacter margulisiae]MBB3187203.1 hypothetical protein [Microbacter margulisiae]
MDNFKTYDASVFYEEFESEEAKRIWDRFEFVFIPKHGRDRITCTKRTMLNRHIATIEKVKNEVEAWQEYRNNKNAKINWQFTNKDAWVKLKRLYPSFIN